jgi:hypothetical protein
MKNKLMVMAACAALLTGARATACTSFLSREKEPRLMAP